VQNATAERSALLGAAYSRLTGLFGERRQWGTLITAIRQAWRANCCHRGGFSAGTAGEGIGNDQLLGFSQSLSNDLGIEKGSIEVKGTYALVTMGVTNLHRQQLLTDRWTQ